MSIPTDRLVAEALAKSGLLWIRSSAGDAPAWHAAVGGLAYVVGGKGEQSVPEHDGICEVITRSKESRARLVSFDALAEPMTADDEDWDEAVAALKAGRLNAPGDDVVTRWQSDGQVLRIRPDLTTVVLRGELLPPPAPQEEKPQEETTATPASAPPAVPIAAPTRPRRTARVSE